MVIKKINLEPIKEKYNKKVDEFIEPYTKLIITSILILFKRGALSSSQQLDKDKTINVKKDDIKLFYSLVSENIKGVSNDMRKEISNELNIGLSNYETKKQLTTRLDNIFNGENPTKLKYKNRLKLILRTESARVFNAGSHFNAKKLNAKKKYLIGTNDNRQGQDSKAILSKYGSPEKAIPIDEPFEITIGGKSYSYLYPPNRPNDRETCIYLYD